MGYFVYAYQIDRDAWSKFPGLDIRHADILVGTAERDNINLIIGDADQILEFPGTILSAGDPIIKTKHFPMMGKKIRRVALDYEGATAPVLRVILYNRRFPGGVHTHDITITDSGRWYGLPVGFKCDYLQFMVTGCETLKYIRYTIV